MAVYYKFKSARDYDSISMDGPFISVGILKEKIFESKNLGRGTDFDLVVTDAQTNEEYLDEAMMIPKSTSVLIRRVPGRQHLPIVTEQEPKMVETQPGKSCSLAIDITAMKYAIPEDSDWDEFGDNLYAIPHVLPVQSSNLVTEAPLTNKADENSKLEALIDTPALDWQHQGSDGFDSGRGFGRAMGRRMASRQGLERKTPPQGYVCHRCKVPGHFIQHCPTNGDPNYDIKRVKPPTGIPRSMLSANPDGSYALPSGDVAILEPNEAAFEKDIEGLPSTRSFSDLPPELRCPLCNDVMKDAVLTSKCCFKSFCDKCIRGYIMSKSKCVCGAKNSLTDDLLPNKTLRDTISRIVEGVNASAENAGSTFHVQDMDSAHCPQSIISSPTSSTALKGEHKVSPGNEGTTKRQDAVDDSKAVSATKQTSERVRDTKAVNMSEATHESMSGKEPASQGTEKRKKKKVRLPINDMPWKTPQDLEVENYMMPMGPPPGYNPYWNGMQPGMEGFIPSYGAMQMMGYGGCVVPQDPFCMQVYMLPVVPPRRDFAEFGMGMNAPHPIMSRVESEARKANLMRKHESERQRERDFSKDREFGREVSSGGNVSSVKSKHKSVPPSSSIEYHRHRLERLSPDGSSRELEPPHPTKRRSEQHLARRRDREQDRDHRPHLSEFSSKEPATKACSTKIADRKLRTSDFSRVSFPDVEVIKKRKLSSSFSTEAANASVSSAHHKVASNGYCDDYKSSGGGRKQSSNDERHFKRMPSMYEASPRAEREEEGRHSRALRGRKHGYSTGPNRPVSLRTQCG